MTDLRALLLFVPAFLCAGCARAGPSPVDEGYVEAPDGVRIFYRTAGERGDTVVVLHGGPGLSMSYLAADLEPLAAQHVLLFHDQRGSGRSTLVADSISLDAQRFVEDLEALRRHFGLDRLTLLGHSWGAGLAALYAAKYPQRVGRLVLVNPGAVSLALEMQAFAILDSRRDSVTRRRLQLLETTYLANPADAAACRAYHELFFAAALADAAAQQRSRGDFCAGAPEARRNKVMSVDKYTIPSLGDWDLRPALAAVTAPTLVIHGAMDPIPLESAREWVVALPNARLLVLENSGHFSYLEVPALFFPAVRAFLRGDWPAGADVVSRAPPPAPRFGALERAGRPVRWSAAQQRAGGAGIAGRANPSRRSQPPPRAGSISWNLRRHVSRAPRARNNRSIVLHRCTSPGVHQW